MAIINLTKETFKQQISEVDKPVIVDFWAPWCTYCRRIAPAFDKIASQQEDKLIFAKLDIDDAAEIAEEYGVDTIRMVRFSEVLLHRILRRRLRHLSRKIYNL